jgi:hypothetical protein
MLHYAVMDRNVQSLWGKRRSVEPGLLEMRSRGSMETRSPFTTNKPNRPTERKMIMTRTGKIARLPRKVRTELNERLDNGEKSDSILEWLNDLPMVDDILREHFGGAPITPQNLSEWRQGGFREWEFRQQFIEHACETFDAAAEMEAVFDAPLLAGQLAAVVAARYAALLNRWDGQVTPKFEEAVKLLRGLNRDIALLQRTLQAAERHRREHEQAVEKKKKDRLTAPIMAKLESDTTYEVLGGGEGSRAIADFLAAVKYDQRQPESVIALKEKSERLKVQQTKGARRGNGKNSSTGGGSSAPVAPNPTKSNQSEGLVPGQPGEAGPEAEVNTEND